MPDEGRGSLSLEFNWKRIRLSMISGYENISVHACSISRSLEYVAKVIDCNHCIVSFIADSIIRSVVCLT